MGRFVIVVAVALAALVWSSRVASDRQYQSFIDELEGGDAIPQVYVEVGTYCGVPPKLLFSVSWVESRKIVKGRLRPWPWTLHSQGKASYFKSRSAMAHALRRAINQSANVDIGLMQLNWHWKFDLLHSAWRATDPTYNLVVACRIIRGHYERTGNWLDAAGHYHREANRPQDINARKRYKRAVRTIWVTL